MEPVEFLKLLFGDKPDELYVALWRLWGKRTYRFRSVTAAGRFARKCTSDIYVCCGLHTEDLGVQKRGSLGIIGGIPGLYADIDIHHASQAVHKKQNLPRTVDQALTILKGHGADPSVIIHSGHGLQAWWLFKEIWLFDRDMEAEKATHLSRRLCASLRGHADAAGKRAGGEGWGVDGTWDLTRVLRIPGTFNCKERDRKIPVTLIEHNTVRYNPEDLEELLVELDEDRSPGAAPAACAMKKQIGDGLAIDPEARISTEDLDDLKDNFERFMATWERKRRFPSGDNSSSEYHMSLASFAAQLRWDDQKIADLLIAWNRRHKIDIKKLQRRDYVAHTILKARKAADAETADKATETASLVRGTDFEEPDRTKRAVAAMTNIHKRFGVKILRIVQWASDPITYTMVTSRGEFNFGSIDTIDSQTKFRRFIKERMLVAIPKVSGKKWDEYAADLLALVERKAPPKETTDQGRLEDWLAAYLEPRPELPIDEAVVGRQPFVKGGAWHIQLEHFHNWVHSKGVEGMGLKQMAALMDQRMDCAAVKFNVYIGGRRTSRRFWRIAHRICQPETQDGTQGAGGRTGGGNVVPLPGAGGKAAGI